MKIDSLYFQGIKTPRVLIRPARLSDALLMHEAMKDSFKALKAWMPWAQSLASLEDTEYYLSHSERLWQAHAHDGVELPLQLFSLDETKYYGASGIKPQNLQVPSFEVGYWVNQHFTGQGLITESMNGLVHYLFDALNARRVEINCERDNIKSKQVPIRLGFGFEGQLKNHRLTADGKSLTDSLIYGCTEVSQLPPIQYDYQ